MENEYNAFTPVTTSIHNYLIAHLFKEIFYHHDVKMDQYVSIKAA